MANTTTTNDKRESYPGIIPEQVGRRASVLSAAAHFLELHKLMLPESAPQPQVNEGPVINSTMTIDQKKREKLTATEPYPEADLSNTKELLYQDDYIAAIASDEPAVASSDPVVSDQEASARAALQDIFGPGSSN